MEYRDFGFIEMSDELIIDGLREGDIKLPHYYNCEVICICGRTVKLKNVPFVRCACRAVVYVILDNDEDDANLTGFLVKPMCLVDFQRQEQAEAFMREANDENLQPKLIKSMVTIGREDGTN